MRTASKQTVAVPGAMDSVAGALRVVVLTDHQAKDGSPKVVAECELVLRTLAPGVDVDLVRGRTAAAFTIELTEKDE